MQSEPRRRQDWRILMAIFSVNVFLDMTAWGQVQAFTPLYLKNQLGVTLSDVPRWTGILASCPLVIAVPLSPFWGVLADRYSRKAVIVRSEIVSTIAYAIAAVSSNVWHFLGARFLMGLAYGNIAIVMATQSMATPARNIGTAMGIIQMASTIASSAGPLFGSFIINAFGMRTLFVVSSCVTLTSALVITLFVKEPAANDRTTPVWEKLKLMLAQVASVPTIRWNFLAWFLIFCATAAMDPFLPVLIDRLSGSVDSATTIGVLLAGYGLLTGLGTPVAGWLSGRVGAARLFLLVTPLLVLIATGVGLAGTLSVLGVLVLVRAIPQAGTSVVLYSHLATHTAPKHRATVMSLTPMPRNSAWLLAPAVASVASGFGLSWVFFFAAGLYTAASVVAVLLFRASRTRFDASTAS